MSAPVGSICLVANDLAYIVRSGGIGTYYWALAHVLAHAGALADVPRRLAKAGIDFLNLDAFTVRLTNGDKHAMLATQVETSTATFSVS